MSTSAWENSKARYDYFFVLRDHRRPEGGGQPGAVGPLWDLKIMTSYAVSVQNTLNVSLATSALASDNPKFSLNRQKNRENIFVRALSAAE